MNSIPVVTDPDVPQDRHLAVIDTQSIEAAEPSAPTMDAKPIPAAIDQIAGEQIAVDQTLAIDLKTHCSHQLQRLCQQLPTLAARLIYLDANNRSISTNWSSPHSITANNSLPDIPPQFLEGFHASIPPQSTTITLHLLESSSATDSQDPQTYLCPFHQTGDRYEYLFLKTERPLTDAERTLIHFWADSLNTLLPLLRQQQSHQRHQQATTQKLHHLEHQLRNPLAAIELFAHILSMELPAGPQQDRANAIHDAAETIADRLLQTLKESTTDDPKSWCNLQDIASEAIALLQPRWQNKHLSIEVPDKPISIYVHRSQIQQVLENLLDNAIAYSPEGDTILCQWWGDAQGISVEVCDRGPGLLEEELHSVFLPHYSRRQGGSGMGLTIAQTYIHRHGGEIGCQNLPGGRDAVLFHAPHD